MFRGLFGVVLPREFMELDEQLFAGGVELVSTSLVSAEPCFGSAQVTL